MLTDALWVTENQFLDIRPLDIADEPGPFEVQIRVKACGICAFDSALYCGISATEPMPYTLGHEAMGVIEKTGSDVTEFQAGDLVFSGMGGGFSRMVNLRQNCIAKVPDACRTIEAGVLEPACCITSLIYQTGFRPGDHVVLVGGGYMGLLTVQGLTHTTPIASLTVFEPVEERRVYVTRYGATKCLDPNAPEGRSKVETVIRMGGADVVIEMSGSASGFQLANRLIRKGGKLVLGAWHRSERTIDGTGWHLSGVQVMNLAPQSNRHFEEMIPATALLVQRGVYDPGALVTHTAKFEDLNAVNHLFHCAVNKLDGYLKGVILF